MSDDQDQPRRGGDAGTDRALDELRLALEQMAARMAEDLAEIRAIAASVAERDLTAEIQALRVDVATLVGRASAERRADGDGDGTLLEQLQDNLADVASGEVVGALWDEVRQLRAELGDGLVVEPSDALSTSLDALKSEIDSLRTDVSGLRAGPEPVDGRDLPTGPASPDAGAVDAVADQVASLRDFLAVELETVRQALSAAASSRPEPDPVPVAPAEVRATMDPEAIEVLRDEIRASGAIADEVIDALREELKALRRRIAVKASERVLDDQQLAQIADAVAARLAEGGGDG